ncbi:hypothetical protein L1987_35878 [Smallanthus sonchifolius]|uniref:Uncharacterized protein n=1 Tax=Smallanthus sonchifolius TaxID=185202 RepID=A0ACB9HCH2_9ASTR|nr:hypothetical protein L1987_35878 [Smallanthus sonchifolius]
MGSGRTVTLSLFSPMFANDMAKVAWGTTRGRYTTSCDPSVSIHILLFFYYYWRSIHTFVLSHPIRFKPILHRKHSDLIIVSNGGFLPICITSSILFPSSTNYFTVSIR